MRWIDYREKLSIGFSDKRKANMLSNKIATFVDYGKLNANYTDNDYYRFCLMVGISYTPQYPPTDGIKDLFIKNGLSISEIISYYIAFVNTQAGCDAKHREDLIDVLCDFLYDLDIMCEVFWDDDGGFVFPKGVPELDEALVSEPLTWLCDYPDSEKAWAKALKAYSEANEDSASDVADKFRRALETFFHEFFETDKTLENLRPVYGSYLKEHGVPKEISNNFEALLKSYTDFMNSYAKHHDKTQLNVLEYIMYQTGNTIRLLITIKD